MAKEDWNWALATDLQDYPWDCAACSTAWAMRACGHHATEESVIAGLGPTRISPTYGLLDASGAGLVEYLAEVGITAQNNAAATWQDILDAAGHQPMVAGGRSWNHWTAIRMGGPAWGRDDFPYVLLMNPSPGWKGIEQYLGEDSFDTLGPWSAVWFTAW